MSCVRMAGINGSVAAKTDSIDAAGVNAGFDERFANGLGTALAKGAIVFVGAALVTMAFDFHSIRRVGFEVIGDSSDFGMFARLDDRAVVLEVNCVGFQVLAIFGPTGMASAHGDTLRSEEHTSELQSLRH